MTTDQELYNAISIVSSNMSFSNQHKDPFGRLITVTPNVLDSFDHRNSKHPDDFDEVITGSATSTLNDNTVSINMTTTTASGDSVTRQTFRQFEYTRGNGQLFLISCNPGGPGKAGNKREWGAGDASNGAFFCLDSTGFSVCIRSKITGSVVETSTAKASFNLDKLDGTGTSGITLDLSKQNLFFIQYSWLGTNIVQFGVLINGKQIFMHQHNTANESTTPWCQSGFLPIHFKNSNTSATESSTTFSITCSSVFSIGASDKLREFTTVSTGITPIAINTTDKVCAGIRLRTDKRYIGAVPISYQILPVSGAESMWYRVIIRSTLTGATWANISDYTQGLTNTPTFSGGYVIDEGYCSLGSQGRIITTFIPNLENYLGYSINGTPDSLIIVAKTIGGSGSFLFTGTIGEVV